MIARGVSQLEQNGRTDVPYFWRHDEEVIELAALAFNARGQEREQLSVIITKPTGCRSGWPEPTYYGPVPEEVSLFMA